MPRIPGTPKPTLYKPGADKLCELCGLADTYPDERMQRVEDWDRDPPLFDYEVTCVLVHKSTGVVVAEGKGFFACIGLGFCARGMPRILRVVGWEKPRGTRLLSTVLLLNLPY